MVPETAWNGRTGDVVCVTANLYLLYRRLCKRGTGNGGGRLRGVSLVCMRRANPVANLEPVTADPGMRAGAADYRVAITTEYSVGPVNTGRKIGGELLDPSDNLFDR